MLEKVASEFRADVQSSRILIIDDDPVICEIVKHFLESQGITNIQFTVKAKQGLQWATDSIPDLIILDVNMPDLNGRDVIREIKSRPSTKNIPVLVITADDDRKTIDEMMRLGASNVIAKPIDKILLVERACNLLEREIILKKLVEFQDRLTSELQIAQLFQESLFPPPELIKDIERQYPLHVSRVYEPCSELGGDFWEIRVLDPKRIAVLTADFSGHGVYAALNTFRLHAFLADSIEYQNDPSAFLASLNLKLCKVLSHGHFATMNYSVIDFGRDEIRYASAGAPSPIFGDLANGTVAVGDGSGVPLGIDSQVQYEERVIPFKKDSFYFLASDALTEAKLKNGRRLETDGIVGLVTQSMNEDDANPCVNLYGRFKQQAMTPLADDLTMLWITRLS